MKKRSRILRSAGITISAISFLVFCLILPQMVSAKQNVVPVEGMSYNVNSSLADNLKSMVGKKVSVTLDSGTTFTGTVKEVGEHQIHLEKLEGRDYFDALIQIQNISAIDARFRMYQR